MLQMLLATRGTATAGATRGTGEEEERGGGPLLLQRRAARSFPVENKRDASRSRSI